MWTWIISGDEMARPFNRVSSPGVRVGAIFIGRRWTPHLAGPGARPAFARPQISLLDRPPLLCWNPGKNRNFMRQIPKTELSPENGCVIDTKWKLGPLSYHACAAEIGDEPAVHDARMPELVVYDHVGFRGAYARTNLSFLFLG